MALAGLRPPCEAAAARLAPETPGCAAHARKWVLGATVLASSIVFLSATVINVALPAIQAALAAPVPTMQWIASTYTLALAALTLVGGALGDRFGRRRLLLAGLALFSLASLAAGLATTSLALIAARALQGVAAALVAPNSLAHLSASLPRAERGRALGIWSAASALTGGAAPLLGGWLVDVASWRAVFLLGVPPALLALAVIAARVPESRAPGGGAALDLAGAALAAGAFAALTGGLIAVGAGVGTAAAALLGGGVLLLVAFVWVEGRVAAPMMPLALFRSRAFSAANLLTLLLYFAVSATFFLLPFRLVEVYGYSATLTGAAFLPFAAVMGALAGWAGGLPERWGARAPLVAGPLCVAAGLFLFALPGAGDYWSRIAPSMALLGLGMAVTAAPLTGVVMGAVDSGQAGIASGINNTVARLAGLLAVAIAGLVAVEVFDAALDEAFRAVTLYSALLAVAAAACAALGIDGRTALAAAPAAAPFVCEHLGRLTAAAPRGAGCEACLRAGTRWVHLRACLACGHVGCCDASAQQHATRHFRATGHAVVQTLAPGESWRWCYLDEHVV